MRLVNYGKERRPVANNKFECMRLIADMQLKNVDKLKKTNYINKFCRINCKNNYFNYGDN